MTLAEHSIHDISYTSSDNTVTERTIIPYRLPSAQPQTVLAIDVSDLADDDRRTMMRLVDEYGAYKQQIMAAMMSFEDWVNHTYGTTLKVKWRSFNPTNIRVL